MYDLIVKDVSVYYDSVCALENIDLKVEEKDFLAIVGPNGGGKSTLLKVLLGLLKPHKGDVEVKGNVPIGYVPQFTAFDKKFPVSVLDVVLMGKLKKPLRFFHKYKKEEIESVENIMEILGVKKFKDRQISQLSGGQMQKVLIARALATNPKILLLDEPTASLDSEAKLEIYELLARLNKKMTVVVVSHDLGIISSYAKNVACLNRKLQYIDQSKVKNNKGSIGCAVDMLDKEINTFFRNLREERI